MQIKVKIRYLGHSGFAVETEDTVLIFDYYMDEAASASRSLATGVIEPSEIMDKKVLVFVSHGHSDHFNPIIFSWKDSIPDIRYFLSSDISARYSKGWIHILNPGQIYEEDNLTIRTFESTDEGIAFLININGVSIYHAGDLNWWYWDGEPGDWNDEMTSRFKQEVSLIGEFPIDIAFLTADPRQEASALWGISYFLKQIDVKIAFPMHFGTDYSIMERIKDETDDIPELSKVQGIAKRGQYFEVNL